MPYVLTGRWTLGRALCKLWLVMDYLLCSASVFNIVLISYDRFLSVTRAVSGNVETRPRPSPAAKYSFESAYFTFFISPIEDATIVYTSCLHPIHWLGVIVICLNLSDEMTEAYAFFPLGKPYCRLMVSLGTGWLRYWFVDLKARGVKGDPRQPSVPGRGHLYGLILHDRPRPSAAANESPFGRGSGHGGQRSCAGALSAERLPCLSPL
jgi:hypothetical protein